MTSEFKLCDDFELMSYKEKLKYLESVKNGLDIKVDLERIRAINELRDNLVGENLKSKIASHRSVLPLYNVNPNQMARDFEKATHPHLKGDVDD